MNVPQPRAVLAAVLASLAWPALAQEPPVPSPSTLVEEVEVIGRLPGPALWRVSTPTSQIWLFALPGSGLPRGFKWNDARVAKALDGARELVLPPVASGGFGDLMALLLDPGHIIHLPLGQTVRSNLPADLRARWEDAARTVGQDAAHYDHWRPVIAALALMLDADKKARLDPSGGRAQLMALSRTLHVKGRPVAGYRAMDLIKGLADTPEAASQACLRLAVDTAQTTQDDTLKAAEAWARGDIDAVRARNDRSAECLGAVPEVVRLRDRVAADSAKNLKEELGKPGKAVVAADLDTLTRKGGLLDQLKAEGLEVIGPAWQ